MQVELGAGGLVTCTVLRYIFFGTSAANASYTGPRENTASSVPCSRLSKTFSTGLSNTSSMLSKTRQSGESSHTNNDMGKLNDLGFAGDPV